MKQTGLLFCALIAVFGLVAVASADTLAFTSGIQTGNQSYAGTVGLDFNVNQTISVTGLGAFDSQGKSISGTEHVEIINLATGTVVAGTTASFHGSGNLVGGYDMLALTKPVSLAPGQYSLVAWGFSAADPLGNVGCDNHGAWGSCIGGNDNAPGMNSVNNVISFTGGGRFSGDKGVGFGFPGSLDHGPENRYLSATFTFTDPSTPGGSAVPEPGSLILMGTGLLGVAGGIRRKFLR